MARALEQQAEQMEEYLAGARRLGQLPESAEIAHLANFFVALRQSLGVMWRGGTPRRHLAEVIDVSLSVLPTTRSDFAPTR